VRRALAFLTPLGRGEVPTAATFDWFPLAGALIGLAVGGVWWGSAELWPLAVAAALAVAADLALTGMLHVDGLADSADGLLPHLDRPRRLEVMAAPDVGAFGVAVVGVVLLLRFSALASTRPSPLVVAGVWAASRTVMAVAARSLPYARAGGGLASAFLGRSAVPVAAGGAALAVALAVVGDGLAGAGAVAAVVAGAAAVLGVGVRRLGGFTGDVLGAAGIVGETAGLLVLAARW
jgi:adenosylcobinamide-GDP ribazoletransferase